MTVKAVCESRSAAGFPAGWRVRRIAPVAVFAFLALASCSDVTGPPLVPPPEVPRLPAAAQPQAATLAAVVLAEWQRVGANLPQTSQRDALSRALTAIAAPLNSGLYLSTQMPDARAAVAGYQASVPGSAAVQADLDSLRLLLDALQKFLDGLR
jgi:hypothetical protein